MEGSVLAPPARDLLRLLAALADENRFRIVALLAARRCELSSGAVGAALGLSPSLVSHHLSILEAAGVVDRRKDGLCTMNGLRREMLRRHFSVLSQLFE
ncbi:MAG TPA: metalloregulator ArsR/SmtB family transcription factor [Longimicrobiales bacterium]